MTNEKSRTFFFKDHKEIIVKDNRVTVIGEERVIVND